MHRHSLFLLLALLLAACDNSSSTLPPQETTTIIGKIKIYDLNGDLISPPYDNVTVDLQNSAGRGYTETALTSGLWAFRKVIFSDYTAFASRPGYGRSEGLDISQQNPRDTQQLTLAVPPRVKPILDSIRGSWDSGYRFYARMRPDAGEEMDVLVRPEGSDDSHFGIILNGTYAYQLDSNQYIIYQNKRPPWMPAHPEFAAVAYNPAVKYYWVGSSIYRYCSEGPLSNVMRPQ
jgi:hypothetical protein